MVVESTPSVFQDVTVYRFYIQTLNAEDQLSAIFSYAPFEFRVDAPSGVFNSALNNTWNASGLSPALLAIYPEMADDTYATLGLEGPASASGLEGASDPTLVEDADQRISPFFLNDGATSLLSNSVSGASWFVTGDASNATAGDDKRVLFMQVSTAGPISGTVNAQIFELGVPSSDIRVTIDFDGEGVFSESGPVQACGCTDATAFNYDPEAEYDNGSCVAVVEGVHGCDGVQLRLRCGATRTTATAVTTRAACMTTPWACAAAAVLRTRTATGCVTTWMTVWAKSTHAAFATALATSTNVVATPCQTATVTAMATSLTSVVCAVDIYAGADFDGNQLWNAVTSQPATAIATGTNSTPWACVAATALRMRTATGCVTTKTTAWASWTSAACATALVRPTTAGVTPFPRATAIAKATSWTRWACAVESARWIWTWMAFATTSTRASETWMNVAFATAQVRCTSADVISCLWAIAIARATKWMPWACAVAAVKPMPTAMGCATTKRSSDAWT